MRKELINVKISKGFELEMISRKPKKWYNLRMKRSAEVFTMKDYRGSSVSDLNFIYKCCKPVNDTAIRTWTMVPEFVDRIRDAKESGIFVDAAFVLHTMKKITESDFEKYGEASKYQKRHYYRAIRALERVVIESNNHPLGALDP